MSDLATDLRTSAGLAEHHDEVQIVDCREPYEWVAGRIEGSVHAPASSVLARAIGALDAGKPTVVVCRSGSRSERATLMLQARGFEAYHLEHGLEEWQAEGRALTTPDGQPGKVV